MSTHNLCFEAKIRTCIPQFCYIKVGFKGVYISWTWFPDVSIFTMSLGHWPYTYLDHPAHPHQPVVAAEAVTVAVEHVLV